MSDETPETIRTLAEGCARFVVQALKVELDGTPDTLPILDHYLTLAREDDARSRGEVLGLVATSAGAYFGEVVRGSIPGARWHAPSDDPSEWRLEFEHVFLWFNPVGMAREAILEDAEAGWHAHLEVLPRERTLLAETLDRLGDVRSDDFNRLAVKWEVLEAVVGALEGAAIARGDESQRFAPAIYATAAGESSNDTLS